jgi:thiamine-monophosphate kinase
MTSESAFVDALRGLAVGAEARGLMDDAAVLEVGGRRLVVTKDVIVEGVHYRSDDPPGDVAWKLVAVNLSDLAAKAARPVAGLLGYVLGEEGWDRGFIAGLSICLAELGLPLIGGDTVSVPAGAPRVLSLTAIGEALCAVPSRSGAAPGDILWVSGTVGDAGAGLAMLAGELPPNEALIRRYRAPQPRLEAGIALGHLVSAMMDVSDGLLIDAARIAEASGASLLVELDAIPLSRPFIAALGDKRGARLRAATSGDDYELLFTAPAEVSERVRQLAGDLRLPLTPIGRVASGAGLQVIDRQGEVPLPNELGYQHGRG